MDRSKVCVDLFKGMSSLQWLDCISYHLSLAFYQYIQNMFRNYTNTVLQFFHNNANMKVTSVVMKIFGEFGRFSYQTSKTWGISISIVITHYTVLIIHFLLVFTAMPSIGRVCIHLFLHQLYMFNNIYVLQKILLCFTVVVRNNIFTLNSSVRFENESC
jgi:hypothetical protein